MQPKYIPVMKLRSSEMKALQHLSQDVKNNILPVIQLLPNSNEEAEIKYLRSRIKELVEAFTGSRMAFFADFDQVFGDGITYIEKFLSMVYQNGLNFIPVISVKHEEASYLNLIKEKYLGFGVCVKFDDYRIKNMASDKYIKYVNQTLEKVKAYYNISESQIDVYFDLNVISYSDLESSEDDFPSLPERIVETISSIEGNYRNVFVSAGSFPKDLTQISVDTERYLARHEWELWKLITDKAPQLKIVYADYGNIHPIYDPDQPNRPGSCSIKYSAENDFYILRGQLPGGKLGTEQYVTKSQLLINSNMYDGENFCWGDKMIYEVANKRTSTGNAGKWVQYTLNHHITKMIDLVNKHHLQLPVLSYL